MRDTTAGYAVATGTKDDTVEFLTLPNPALGVDAGRFVVPGDEVWEPIMMTGHLATGVTVANRLVGVIIDNGTTQLARVTAGANETASNSFDFTTFPGAAAGTAVVAGSGLSFPLPTIVLQPGWRIGFSTLLIQATDQWSGLALTIRRRIRIDQITTLDDYEREVERSDEYEHLVERLGI